MPFLSDKVRNFAMHSVPLNYLVGRQAVDAEEKVFGKSADP